MQDDANLVLLAASSAALVDVRLTVAAAATPARVAGSLPPAAGRLRSGSTYEPGVFSVGTHKSALPVFPHIARVRVDLAGSSHAEIT